MGKIKSSIDKLSSAFGGRRNTIIVLAAIAVVIVLLAVVLVILLTSQPKTVSTANTAGDASSSKGTVSNLRGSVVVSRANLKGLTLRINQIETCNPTVVSAYVAVSSNAGVVNKNFTKDDVKIYVDNKQITDFEFNPVDAKQTPITSVLAIDRSGSMKGEPIDRAKAAATQYINSLQDGDRAGLVAFSTGVDVLSGLTNDKTALINAVNGVTAVGETSLYDAVAKSVAITPDCGRKAAVVLTDGDDTRSSSTQDSVIADANKANMPVFMVGIKGDWFKPDVARTISESTGAQYLEANTPAEITDLYAKIDGQLKGQFVANLKLSIARDGKAHTLKIVSTVEGSETESTREFVY